jgi:pyridoxamine 5'-phosphate oxidase-like protein
VHRVALGREESLRLLGSVPMGRVVFTANALPSVRPVNHVIAGGLIVFRTHKGAAIAQVTRVPDPLGVVVAFEADRIDPVTHRGWSVIVTGYAVLIDDPLEVAWFADLPAAWLDEPMAYLVSIMPELVDGFLLV